jgi:hypothetical protein
MKPRAVRSSPSASAILEMMTEKKQTGKHGAEREGLVPVYLRLSRQAERPDGRRGDERDEGHDAPEDRGVSEKSARPRVHSLAPSERETSSPCPPKGEITLRDRTAFHLCCTKDLLTWSGRRLYTPRPFGGKGSGSLRSRLARAALRWRVPPSDGKRVRSSEVERPACPEGRGFESHRVLHANSSVVEQKIWVLPVAGSNPATQMACYAMQR